MTPVSALQAALRAGRFTLTAELTPPDSADPDAIRTAALPLSGLVTALNATDAPGARCHVSSVAMCKVLLDQGIEPVMQVSCRDRNRIAIQGDVLGAASLGIRNILCVTGDGVATGDQPGAKPVFDLDSVSALTTLRRMRDEGRFLSGRSLAAPLPLFLGAVENPCTEPLHHRADRMARKIDAGAQFIQTNHVFDIPRFRAFMARAHDMGLTQRAPILAGIGPLASAATARWMASRVPGIRIPESLIRRIETATDPAEEALAACLEQIDELRRIPGLAGLHLMAHKRETMLAELIRRSF